MWAVFLENILLLKVCFQTITSLKNPRITKEGLQRNKDHKRKMKKDLLKLAKIWNITKSLQGAEAATRRFSIKSVFKNCAKFTGKSICRGLSCNKFAGMNTKTLLKYYPYLDRAFEGLLRTGGAGWFSPRSISRVILVCCQ